MAHFALQMADGSVAITQTVGNTTIEEVLAKWRPEEAAKVISSAPIDPADIPTSRLFRNAWCSDGSKVAVDMDLASEAHLADVRRARDQKLLIKDQEWLAAFSRDDMAAAATVEAERQKLRDVPQSIDADLKAAATPEELKAIWPAELEKSVARQVEAVR